jgi:PDZ domain-containing protein
VFKPRDQINSVNGKKIESPSDVVDAVRGEPIGTTFVFEIRRAAENMRVEVTSAPNPDSPELPYIGISVGELYSADFDIDFTLQDVGGPSAGLMFAAGISMAFPGGESIGLSHVQLSAAGLGLAVIAALLARIGRKPAI